MFVVLDRGNFVLLSVAHLQAASNREKSSQSAFLLLFLSPVQSTTYLTQ
jgi:hypothetical protein